MINTIELPESQEKVDPNLEKLWRTYRFFGKPPLKGSLAEERLIDLCNRYTNLVTSQLSSESSFPKENSEDYFAQFRKIKLPSSDRERRDLHNEIALMVLGERRDNMDIQTAEKIADFACVLTRGYSLEKHEED